MYVQKFSSPHWKRCVETEAPESSRSSGRRNFKLATDYASLKDVRIGVNLRLTAHYRPAGRPRSFNAACDMKYATIPAWCGGFKAELSQQSRNYLPGGSVSDPSLSEIIINRKY
jgi:hypothetical protein